jgi:hypothetical protein
MTERFSQREEAKGAEKPLFTYLPNEMQSQLLKPYHCLFCSALSNLPVLAPDLAVLHCFVLLTCVSKRKTDLPGLFYLPSTETYF